MPGKYQDDYDDYEEDDFYDDYDDAADDWEAEAAEEEEKAQAEAAMKAALAEKKLQTRAPAATQRPDEDDVDDGAAMPEDVMREVEHMRQVANDTAAGGDLVSGAEHTELLADAPTETADDMRALGVKVANHLLTFADAPNFDAVLTSLFESLGKEFKTVPAINDNFTRVEKATESSKKSNKAAKKKKGGRGGAAQAANAGNDALNMDVEDKGGAYVEDGDTFF